MGHPSSVQTKPALGPRTPASSSLSSTCMPLAWSLQGRACAMLCLEAAPTHGGPGAQSHGGQQAAMVPYLQLGDFVLETGLDTLPVLSHMLVVLELRLQTQDLPAQVVIMLLRLPQRGFHCPPCLLCYLPLTLQHHLPLWRWVGESQAQVRGGTPIHNPKETGPKAAASITGSLQGWNPP